MASTRYETIIVTDVDGVARLTLNRPDRLNAFTGQMHAELRDALDLLAAGTCRLLIVTGAGRGFCAGQDLSERNPEAGRNGDLGANLDLLYNPLIRRLAALPFPTLALVNGVAAGAGVSLALACDIAVAPTSAKFVFSFARIGLVPDAGATWFLRQRLGLTRAMALAMTGATVTADEAARSGLIWRAIPDERFDAEAEALAKSLREGPTRSIVAARQAIHAAGNATLDAQLELERALQSSLGRTLDYAEGVRAFKEKREPRFVGD